MAFLFGGGKKKKPKFEKIKLKARVKMAKTRLNMKKDKTLNQIKILKREIATLLSEEKDESARIKVETVIRDEFLVEAIDIVQNFLELVFARLALLAEMKNCPHDLKEAVSTLIYVAPRMENVPELLAIRTQFAAKYGNPFVVDAMNNKDLAVNKRVMWKLSIKVPEPSLCISYLKVIAQEHNIDWKDKNPVQLVQTNFTPTLNSNFGGNNMGRNMDNMGNYGNYGNMNNTGGNYGNMNKNKNMGGRNDQFGNQVDDQFDDMNNMKQNNMDMNMGGNLGDFGSGGGSVGIKNNEDVNFFKKLEDEKIPQEEDHVSVQNVDLQPSMNFLQEINIPKDDNIGSTTSPNSSNFDFDIQPDIKEDPPSSNNDFDELQKRFNNLRNDDD